MAKKIPQKVNKAIKEYVKAIKKDMPIHKVILYGSYAKKKARKTSDIDLAIISEKLGKNLKKKGNIYLENCGKLKNPTLIR